MATKIRKAQLLIELPAWRVEKAVLSAGVWRLPMVFEHCTVYRNGVAQMPGADYTIEGDEIKFLVDVAADEAIMAVGY